MTRVHSAFAMKQQSTKPVLNAPHFSVETANHGDPSGIHQEA